MKKRIISIVLAICMVLTLVPTVAFAESFGDFEYSILGDEVTITRYKGNEFSVVIPDTIEGKTVKFIGNDAFSSCSYIKNVTFGEDSQLESIGATSFMHCYSLESINIPNSVISIGGDAFSACFNLKSIVIPNSVTYIGERAFFNCDSLESIVIPESVTYIGNGAFHSCISNESFTVDENNTTYSSVDGVLFNKNITELIQYPCGNSNTSYSIPDSVKSIGNNSFATCNKLKSVTFGKDSQLESIGSNSFNNCHGLESINIPNGVTSIGDLAFSQCTNLKSIIVPNSVTSIGLYIFNFCDSMESVFLSENISSISTLSIPDTATTVEYYLDEGNSRVTINSVSLGSNRTAFELPSIISGYPVKIIKTNAFNNCTSLESVILPYNIYISDTMLPETASQIRYSFDEAKGEVAITGISLVSGKTVFEIPSAICGYPVKTIGERAFVNCTELKRITIPDSVTSIGNLAFNGCTGLSIVVIPNSVKSIGIGAFYNCTGLTSIAIPYGVTSIGNYAFKECISLKSIIIPGSVTSIGNSAFTDCISLGVIFLPDNISVSNTGLPDTATSVKYSLDTDKGEITVTEIDLADGNNAVAIPETIGGYPVVAVVQSEQSKVGKHKCADDTATCLNPQTCSLCGKTYSIHDFTKQDESIARALKTAGNCQIEAVYYYSCSRCGEVEFDDNHTFTGDKDPNVHTDKTEWTTNETQHEQKCCDCGGIIVNYENHTWDNGVCSVCGYTCVHKDDNTDHKCDFCGSGTFCDGYIVVYEWSADRQSCTATASCKKHKTPVIVEKVNTTSRVIKPAQCEADGEMEITAEFKSDLFDTLTTTQQIKAIGHNYSIIVTQATHSTCTTHGKTAVYRCANGCTKTIGGEELPLDSSNHQNIVIDKAVEETSTKSGLTEGKHCSSCNKVIVAQTAIPANPTLALTEGVITKASGDKDFKGSSYAPLKLRQKSASKTGNTITWSKVTGADGYIVYASKCGSKLKKVKVTKATTYTHKKLKKGTYYKYVVVAYKNVDGKKVNISASKMLHIATQGGKYGNAKAVKTNKSTISLKEGKSFVVKASNVKKDNTIKKHRAICFESSNTNIATVNSNGKIVAKSKGKCKIYVYSQNGVSKAISVTVK